MGKKNWVRQHPWNLISTSPEGMHPQVLTEPVNTTARPLAIIFERSWQPGEIPEDWKKANGTSLFKNGKKEPQELPAS